MRGLPRRGFRLKVRELEGRVTPSVTASLTGNAVAFLGDGANDHLALSTNAAGYLSHNLQGFESAIDLDPAPGVQSRLFNALTAITVDLGDGSDALDITRVAAGAGIANVEAFRYALATNETGGDVTLTDNALTVNDVPAAYMFSLNNTVVTQITGESGDNTIDASAWTRGGMTIYGQAGNDTLRGGSGNDFLEGANGDDTLEGNDGDDFLDWNNFSGTYGNDTLRGGAGSDSLGGGFGNDSLDGGSGDDFLSGNVGDDQFHGGPGYDRLEDVIQGHVLLTNTNFTADGLTSADHGCEYGTIFGSEAANTIDLSAFSGPGGFIVYGYGGADTLLGGMGNDTLDGGDGNDVIAGNDGNDVVAGGRDDDDLNGGSGNDSLFGYLGLDHFQGGPGLDRLDDHILAVASLNDTAYIADGLLSADHGCEYGSITGSNGDDIIDLEAWSGLGFSFGGGGGYDVARINATAGPDLLRLAGNTVMVNGSVTTIDASIESLVIDAGAGIDRGEVTASITLPDFTVLNLEPTISPVADVVNADETFLLEQANSFTDIGGGQSWTATVNYGTGGGFEPLAVNAANRSFVLQHDYTTDGIFPVCVRVTDDQGNVGESTFTVQRTFKLQVGGATAQRSQVENVKIAFQGAVNLTPGWFSFEKLTPGSTPNVTAEVQTVSGKTVATLSFSGGGLEMNGSLADGRYRLTLHGTQIANGDLAGDFAYDFHRVYGDANGDRLVDATDFAVFGNAFGQSVAGSPFDYDGNGAVDSNDLAAFGNRFGMTL